MSAPGDLNHSGAARLIAQLQGEGELDSAGAFTLDRERARQKIQRFQLANPARYVLELVQAAVLKGAQNLVLSVDFDDFHLRCDGQPFTLADFEHVYAALFLRATERPEQARRHLALGLCTAMALDPAVVRIESGDATGGAFLELRRGVPDRFGPQAHGPHRPLGNRPYTTHVHVRQRLRLQLLKRFFLDRDGQLAEDLLLRKRCQYARVAIWLNGQSLTSSPQLPQTSQPQRFAVDDIQGLVGPLPVELKGWPLAQPRPFYPDLMRTELHLVKNGVWVATVYPEALLPGFQAVADCPQLRQDISHEHVVQDETYQRVIQVVLQQQIARLAADCGRVMERLAAFSEWTINALRSLLMALLQRLGSLAILPESRHLLDFPLLRSAGEQWVTLRQLGADTRAHGSLAISAVASSEPDPQRPLVLHLPEPAEAELLASLLGCPVVDRAAALQQALRRRQNRDAWLNRRMTPTLGNQSFLARTRIDEPGITGELGVTLAVAQEQRSARRRLAGTSRPNPSEQPVSRLLLVREGCLLVEKPILTPVPGLTLIVEADFTPSALFDGVVGDAILSAALTAAFAALVPLLQALTTAPLAPTLERLRARTVRSLVWLLLSGPAQRQVRLMAGVEPRVADAEPPLAITGPVLWDYLRDWPLLDGLGQGLVSLAQLDTWASEYGCVPVLMLPPAKLAAFRQDPQEAYRYETFRLQYPEPLWPAAHARDPGKARSPTLPKLVVVLSSAEREFAELLRVRLGDRYADLHDWLQVLRPTPPGPEPATPPRTIRNDCWVYVAFAQGAGYLGLCCVPNAQRPLNRTVVELYRGATLVRPLELPLPTGDMLVASVDLTRFPTRLATPPEPPPGPAHDQALADELTHQLGRALPGLVAAVLSGQTIPPDERLWLLRLAGALFPTLLFRRAYDRLSQQAAPTAAGRAAAEREYAQLLQLAVTLPLQTVAAALQRQLAAPGDEALSLARLTQELGQAAAASGPAVAADLLPALSWIELLYPQSADVPAGQRVHRPLPQLLHAPMLSSPSGEPLSLAGLLADLRQHGQVLYAPTASGALAWSHQTRKVVAIPDAPTWDALGCLLGEQNLLHVATVPGAQSRATALPVPPVPPVSPVLADNPPADAPPGGLPTSHSRPGVGSSLLTAPAPLPPLPAEPAPPALISAAEQLRLLVHAELLQLGQTSGRLLSNVNLARLQIGQKKSPVAVLCNADALLINLRHPMIQYAVEHFAQNRALVFFVASAVYTALNDWLVAVTDDDEAEFHRLLSARASAQLLRPGKPPLTSP